MNWLRNWWTAYVALPFASMAQGSKTASLKARSSIRRRLNLWGSALKMKSAQTKKNSASWYHRNLRFGTRLRWVMRAEPFATLRNEPLTLIRLLVPIILFSTAVVWIFFHAIHSKDFWGIPDIFKRRQTLYLIGGIAGGSLLLWLIVQAVRKGVSLPSAGTSTPVPWKEFGVAAAIVAVIHLFLWFGWRTGYLLLVSLPIFWALHILLLAFLLRNVIGGNKILTKMFKVACAVGVIFFLANFGSALKKEYGTSETSSVPVVSAAKPDTLNIYIKDTTTFIVSAPKTGTETYHFPPNLILDTRAMRADGRYSMQTLDSTYRITPDSTSDKVPGAVLQAKFASLGDTAEKIWIHVHK